MTENPNLEASDTPSAPAGYAYDSDGIARPVPREVGEFTVIPPTHGTTWRPAPPQPLVAILDDEALPEAVHPLAQQWRDLSTSVDEAERDVSEAASSVAAAPGKDSAARREAALQGAKKLPSPTAQQEEAERAHADALMCRDALRGELSRVGAELLAALRAHRADLATRVRPCIEKAVADYREAVGVADQATAAAASALAAATSAIGLLDDLDSGKPFGISAAGMNVRRPDFTAARSSLVEVEGALAGLDTAREPDFVEVESLTNGHRWLVPTSTARGLAASKVVRILSPLP